MERACQSISRRLLSQLKLIIAISHHSKCYQRNSQKQTEPPCSLIVDDLFSNSFSNFRSHIRFSRFLIMLTMIRYIFYIYILYIYYIIYISIYFNRQFNIVSVNIYISDRHYILSQIFKFFEERVELKYPISCNISEKS